MMKFFTVSSIFLTVLSPTFAHASVETCASSLYNELTPAQQNYAADYKSALSICVEGAPNAIACAIDLSNQRRNEDSQLPQIFKKALADCEENDK